MPDNNQFYLGVLSELKKTATATANPASAVTNVARPAAPSSSPPKPITTQAGTNYTPNALPGKPVQVNNLQGNSNPTSYNTAIQSQQNLFKGLGQANDYSRQHPIMTLGRGFGAGYAADHYIEGQEDKALSGVTPFSHQSSDPNGQLDNREQGYLQGDTGMLNRLNNPESGLPSKTMGAASYNPTSNKVDVDYSKVPGYLGNKLQSWMTQHPWLTGIGGGVGIAALLSMFLNKGQTPPSAGNSVTNNYYGGQPSMHGPSSPQFLGGNQ